MKKTLFFLFFLLNCINVFSEELLNFYGIDFGSSSKQVEKIMLSKNWNKKSGSKATYEGGTYAGANNVIIDFQFVNDKFYEVTLTFNKDSLNDINRIENAFIEKYSLQKISKPQNIATAYEKSVKMGGKVYFENVIQENEELHSSTNIIIKIAKQFYDFDKKVSSSSEFKKGTITFTSEFYLKEKLALELAEKQKQELIEAEKKAKLEEEKRKEEEKLNRKTFDDI